MRITLHNYKRPGMVAYRWRYPGQSSVPNSECIDYLAGYDNTIVYISEESVAAVGGSRWDYSAHTAVFPGGYMDTVYGDELEAVSV